MPHSFESLTDNIIAHPRFAQLKNFVHHGEENSVYEHSLCVARTAYRIARRIRLPHEETAEVTRAALLHDFFGYDWHGTRFRRFADHFKGFKRITHMHAFVHGPIAADRARRTFHLSERECEAIVRHMFPLAAMPRTRVAWIVTLADKVVATREVSITAWRFVSASWRKTTA